VLEQWGKFHRKTNTSDGFKACLGFEEMEKEKKKEKEIVFP